MAIVVDELSDHRSKGVSQVRCYMMTDDKNQEGLDKLHIFAARIGLDRLWFEDTPHFPRYVLTGEQRDQALRLGALAVTGRNMLALCCWPRRRAPIQVNLEQRGLFDDE